MRVATIGLIGMFAGFLSAAAPGMEQTPAAASASAASAAPVHWSYSGEHGPAHWGEVAAGDAVCGNGNSQSPIDLASGAAKAGKDGAFKINYEAGAVALMNNGHT